MRWRKVHFPVCHKRKVAPGEVGQVMRPTWLGLALLILLAQALTVASGVGAPLRQTAAAGNAQPRARRMSPADKRKVEEQGPFKLSPDTDRPGMDLRVVSLTVGNQDLCASLCQHDLQCKAFVYSWPRGPYGFRCWLKSGVPAAVAMPGSVSGVKTEKALEADRIAIANAAGSAATRKTQNPPEVAHPERKLFAAAFGLGILGGLISFFYGFHIYRRYRVLADTPELPIRSIAMGLVEIHGTTCGDSPLTSPVSRRPCFYYKVLIERYVIDRDKEGKTAGGHWYQVKTDAKSTQFYLQDATGKVLVHPEGADFDLEVTAQPEITRAGGGLLNRLVYGKTTTSPTGSLQAYLESALSGAAFSVDSMGLVKNLASGSILTGRTEKTDRYRLTEHCLLAGQPYDVTGTCMENPKPRDEHDRNMIAKGRNEPTFVISYRSEKEIERQLRKRAITYIFAGAPLATVCLGLLLWKLELL